jgi:Na+/H+-dicarboxylate symporter
MNNKDQGAGMKRTPIYKVLYIVREELLIVLGTSSSEPVLPRLLQKLQQLGCKKGVVGMVLPAGYSFNLDGTAIYLTLASLFIAQACDIHLSVTQTLTMLGVMLLTSFADESDSPCVAGRSPADRSCRDTDPAPH